MTEKQPRPGSKTEAVFRLLQEGALHDEIVKKTGFSSRVVVRARYWVYHEGYLPKDTEQRKKDLRSSHPGRPSEVQGGIWIAARKYAQMKMSPSEIREAILLETGVYFSPRQIIRTLRKARERGDLPPLTQENLAKSYRDRVRPRQEIRERVKPLVTMQQFIEAEDLDAAPSLIAVRQFIQLEGLDALALLNLTSQVECLFKKEQSELPSDRGFQFALGLFLYSRQKKSEGENTPLGRFLAVRDVLPAGDEELNQAFALLVRLTPISLNVDPQKIRRALVYPGEGTPNELNH